MTFGEAITKARKGRQMLQKDVAARILKQDGEAISAAYLNDIEHSRRHPPNGKVIQQLADMLDLDADYLFFLAGRVPPDLLGLPADPDVIIRAVEALRRALESGTGSDSR